MKLQSYLFFDGRCEEALNFYRDALGAHITAMMRFRDSPEGEKSFPHPEKVMHAEFQIGDTIVMASDGECNGTSKFEGFALSVTYGTQEEVERVFGALQASGEVQMPLSPTFFSPLFGMVRDRFGLTWMILIPADAERK